jgi:hypothetical protein
LIRILTITAEGANQKGKSLRCIGKSIEYDEEAAELSGIYSQAEQMSLSPEDAEFLRNIAALVEPFAAKKGMSIPEMLQYLVSQKKKVDRSSVGTNSQAPATKKNKADPSREVLGKSASHNMILFDPFSGGFRPPQPPNIGVILE